MNINDMSPTATLPPGVTVNAVMDLGAALGRQAAAFFLADDAEGLLPGQRRHAEGLTPECLGETEVAVFAIERRAPGAGDMLASAMRAALWRWCKAHAAHVAEMEADGL